jgi:hypothetical protein
MYIIDSLCISPQETFDKEIFNGKPLSYKGTRYYAVEPDYKGNIPAGILRRMGKAVRMGVGAGLPLLTKYGQTDGIILGTANGGLEDCLKFLNQIVEYDEGTLTPTNFVQSTPNAIAGSLALLSKNTNYNITHVNNGLAFENAILDALMLFEEGVVNQVLIGNVEEISDYNYNIDFLSGSFKLEEVNSSDLLLSDTPGTVCGEGAAMFMMSSERPKNNCLKLLDVFQMTYPDTIAFQFRVKSFLEKHQLQLSDIDTLILGFSGDNRHDHWYREVQSQVGEGCQVISYKNLVGDYPSVSAFALWLSLKLVEGNTLPSEVYLSETMNRKPQNILIYNHNKGIQHGMILLSDLGAID